MSIEVSHLHFAESAVRLVALIPACFMTAVCVTYICVDKIGFNLPDAVAPWIAGGTALLCFVIFFLWRACKADRSKVE